MSVASRLVHLDMLRGLAAMLVLSGHLRAYTFQSFLELEKFGVKIGPLTKAFYFGAGFGHQAVIIFFALSGFLVGGKAIDDLLRQRFSWPLYLLRRLSRLWLVIVPTLLLTIIFDRIGIGLTGGAGYDGRYFQILASGPHAAIAPTDHSILTLAGNLFFLQTIAVPPFGSNSPLWSLANEFWYYVLFPLAAWIVVARTSIAARVGGALVVAALIALLPRTLIEDGTIWVAGAATAWCSRQSSLAPVLTSALARMIAIAGLAVLLLTSRVLGPHDLLLGFGVAGLLPVMAHLPSPGSWYDSVARASSEISYTLYLTHFPLLTLIFMAWSVPGRLPPGLAAVGVFATVLGLAIAWAVILWWCFERNTDRVFAWASRGLRRPEPAVVRI